jgi:hypothetical protein
MASLLEAAGVHKIHIYRSRLATEPCLVIEPKNLFRSKLLRGYMINTYYDSFTKKIDASRLPAIDGGILSIIVEGLPENICISPRALDDYFAKKIPSDSVSRLNFLYLLNISEFLGIESMTSDLVETFGKRFVLGAKSAEDIYHRLESAGYITENEPKLLLPAGPISRYIGHMNGNELIYLYESRLIPTYSPYAHK